MTKNQNVAAMLAARFPQTFVADSSRPHRPLKVGIDRDLVALGVLDEASATRTLRHYCSRLMYRRSLVAGAVRVDLDGQVAGEVATAHAAHAQRIVTRMEASHAAEASDGRCTSEKTAGNAAKAVGTPGMPVAAQTKQEPSKKRLGLSELKAAARARRVAVSG
jgi:sRNA-binding protein